MKSIKFTHHVLPHIVAVAAFLLVTIFFFSPIFFDKKTLDQHDINQFLGSSKTIVDYREKTGEEALWANAMFSGMPAYLVSVKWSNEAISYTKRILSFSFPSPVANIYLAFLCYYIMLLAFGVRPYLAIAGAIAFGLSSYMIIGLAAGHNGRIGSIAFMPLAMAGIHLAFTNRKILGFGVATMGLALHLRENHLQVTYYLVIIVAVYGLIKFIQAVREKGLPDFAKSLGILIVATVIAAGTYFGPFWAVTEYTKYSFRGVSELAKPGAEDSEGLTKEYAFRYRYGIMEPMTLLIPQFYGGSASQFFAQNEKSASYQALAQAGNETFNQLAYYTSTYWGPGDGGPYYAGAIIIFLFVIGILFADKKYTWWLVSISVLSLMLSWGDSFKAFNYFMFDYFPGYNKFRSMNFALVIILFAMPLLGLLGMENLFKSDFNKAVKKKLLIAFGIVGGLCLFLLIFPGILGFTKDVEGQLPDWFRTALVSDRKGLFRSDAFRSLAFISAVFIMLYFNVYKKISPVGFYVFLTLMITIDLAVVNKRYLTDANFKRKRDNTFFTPTEADQAILTDTSYFRVYNLSPRNPGEAFMEARTSYFHNSIGGYHGAKMKRYQDFYDSCVIKNHIQLITDVQQGKVSFKDLTGFNMLNVKYLVYGPERNNIVHNPRANGSAWFVNEVITVNSPTEEIEKTCGIDTKSVAVIDGSKFKVNAVATDSTAKITLVDHTPNYMKYQSQAATGGLSVFSEIYYPGWVARIDGAEVPVLRADYLLRAVEVPSGNHTIEFKFEPKAYTVGNKVTMASSWIALLILLGSIGWSLKREEN